MFTFGGYFTWELGLLCFFKLLFHRSLRKYHQGNHFVFLFSFFFFPSFSFVVQEQA